MPNFSMSIASGQNISIQVDSSLPVGIGNATYHNIQYIDYSTINKVYVSSAISSVPNQVKDTNQTMCIPMIRYSNKGIGISAVGATETPIDYILNADDLTKYMELPAAVQTQNGSLIPQPIVPSFNYKNCFTGLTCPGVTMNQQLPSSVKGGGIVWTASIASMAVQSCPLIYGQRTYYNTINLNNARHTSCDYPLINKRTYKTTLSCGGGAFVFIYSINQETKGQNGVDPDPYLKLIVSSYRKTRSIFTPSFLDSASSNYSSNYEDLQILIRKNDSIELQYKGTTIRGSMNKVQHDLIPPQIKMSNKKSLNFFYVYPTYKGLVITNSISKKNGSGSTLFLPFNNPDDPRHAAKLKGSISDTSITKSLNDTKNTMMWLPAILQQPSSSINVTLNLAKADNMGIGSKFEVVWNKALGQFALIPLYFAPSIECNIYCKTGQDQITDRGSVSGFSPITNPVSTTTTSWIPLAGDNDADDDPFTGKQKRKTTCTQRIFSKSEDTYYCISHIQYHESITRAPMQIFGMVMDQTKSGQLFNVTNSNGSFALSNVSFNNLSSYKSCVNSWADLITNANVNIGFDGVTGDISLDGYLIDNINSDFIASFGIGALNLKMGLASNTNFTKSDYLTGTFNSNYLFKGYGLQVDTQLSDNNYGLSIKVAGVQQKLSDMKLVCAPFWDGDRLSTILQWFTAYTGVPMKMINSGVANITNAHSSNDHGSWKAKKSSNVSSTSNTNYFRVPRSWNWQTPAINFTTGTSCLQALNQLAEKTGCKFVVGNDGCGYFYQIEETGVPLYVSGQTDDDHVSFDANHIINLSIVPQVQNKPNAIATFAILNKTEMKGRINDHPVSISPGLMYTQFTSAERKDFQMTPWTKQMVKVQQGALDRQGLLNVHTMNEKYAAARIFTGSITVPGNLKVNHVYQVIQICGQKFFVQNISHNVDLQSKSWTTTYQIAKKIQDIKGSK